MNTYYFHNVPASLLGYAFAAENDSFVPNDAFAQNVLIQLSVLKAFAFHQITLPPLHTSLQHPSQYLSSIDLHKKLDYFCFPIYHEADLLFLSTRLEKQTFLQYWYWILSLRYFQEADYPFHRNQAKILQIPAYKHPEQNASFLYFAPIHEPLQIYQTSDHDTEHNSCSALLDKH